MPTATLQYSVPHVRREAEDTLQRAQDTFGTLPGLHVAPRLAEAAQALSAVGLAAAHSELCNAALQHAVRLCYQVDTDGRPANIDSVDGRLLFPAPWGSAGHKRWGLRRREADILRESLYARMETRQGRPLPLFVFDAGAWRVNVHDYPTETAAQAYVRQASITAREYKTRLASMRKADRD